MTVSDPDFPNYLRLHIAPTAPKLPPRLGETSEVIELLTSFEEVTGWCLRHTTDDELSDSTCWQQPFRDGQADSTTSSFVLTTLDNHGSSGTEPLPLEPVRAMAGSVCGILQHLHDARHALWQREAELAAGVPVSIRPDEEQHLAERIEGVLRMGAEAIGCDAAAMYLLDDATSHLKLRAAWGLPPDRLQENARPLRGSLADLEALIGHAVALEDTQLLSHWKVPEDYPSAVCVPIATSSVPLGTLWMFSTEQRAFTDEETTVLEVIAGRLASDLEREMLWNEATQAKTSKTDLQRAVQRQQHQLPNVTPMLSGWDIAGWTQSAGVLNGDFYDWGVLPDGRLSVAVGDAQGQAMEAALTASVLHASLKSHACYRHDARQLLVRANETLWTTSLGDQFASLMYAIIDPDTGTCQYSFAGDVAAVVLRSGKTDVYFDLESLPLGADPDEPFSRHKLSLRPGDTLILLSGGVLASLCPDATHEAMRATLKTLPVSRKFDAETTLEHLRQKLADVPTDAATLDHTAIVVHRNGE